MTNIIKKIGLAIVAGAFLINSWGCAGYLRSKLKYNFTHEGIVECAPLSNSRSPTYSFDTRNPESDHLKLKDNTLIGYIFRDLDSNQLIRLTNYGRTPFLNNADGVPYECSFTDIQD